MSGPIVRKYGFPNFEAIFGKRELEHGVDTPEPDATPTPTPESSVEGKAETPAVPGKDRPEAVSPKK